MYSLTTSEIEEVGGGDATGAAASCVTVASAVGRIGALFGPQAGAAALVGGCAVGVALYYWG